MAQELKLEQELKLLQTQKLTAQQMLTVHLLEMPLAQLEEAVEAEIDDNPALEVAPSDEQGFDSNRDNEAPESDDSESFEQKTEREERAEQLDAALDSIDFDDRLPDYGVGIRHNTEAETEEMVYGNTMSFYDNLRQQMSEVTLTPEQTQIMEYLIGSLDDDGLLRKPLDAISDELAIYHHLDVTTDQVAEVLSILQDFDPAGIGARSLQECLLLQLNRRPDSPRKQCAQRIISQCFPAFERYQWDKIGKTLHLSDFEMEEAREEIRRLNPKPGAALGETEGRSIRQITPDFIIETQDDGSISFSLNQGNLPELYVSPSFLSLLDSYRANKEKMSRQDKEALLYAKDKIGKAQGFIEAVRQRRRSMNKTMQAIIKIQAKFFQEGDESDLKPMTLKDVAQETGLDISTISRVSNVKYAQTRWGIFPLRYFFSDGYTTGDGEELSTRKLKNILQEIVNNEDKQHPLNDDALKAEMTKRGYPIARRTVAKYRDQLGIPTARFRR